MKNQVHIRNAEAAHLARTLAHETGRTINEVVLDALRQYRPARRASAPPEQIAHWKVLLRHDREAHTPGHEVPLESLYDRDTGLPA